MYLQDAAAIPQESSATWIAGQKWMLCYSFSDASNRAETSLKLSHCVSILHIFDLAVHRAADTVEVSATNKGWTSKSSKPQRNALFSPTFDGLVVQLTDFN